MESKISASRLYINFTLQYLVTVVSTSAATPCDFSLGLVIVILI